MKLIYSIGVWSYAIGVRLASPFSLKAKQWLEGRKNWQDRLPKRSGKAAYWFHCASLGEFEQARPIMEYYASQGVEIYLSFFSPSGYEQKKNWELATWVAYLPLDSAKAAKTWVENLNPEKVFFVKYEFWYHYLKAVHAKQIPLYLISARLRAEQPFFKWYGSVYREMLAFYTHIFTQDKASVELLYSIGVDQASHTGDTRFDRVLNLKNQKKDLVLIENFVGAGRVGVLGSSWPEEEKLLNEVISDFPAYKWILVPHDISEAHLKNIEGLFESKTVRYSQYDTASDKPILIVDSIGILSQVYAYAHFAFVGGGFKNALHNILEAAVWGIPVIYGDNIAKYPEGKSLSDAGGGFMVRSAADLKSVLKNLESESGSNESGRNAENWVVENAGATQKILNFLD